MPDSDTDFTKGQHLDPQHPVHLRHGFHEGAAPGPAAPSASQEPQRSVINVLILKLIVKEKKKTIHLTIMVWEREIETEFLYEAQVGLELAL